MRGVLYAHLIKGGIGHVFEFFQGVGQDGRVQIRAWDPHHQKQCGIYVYHFNDSIRTSDVLVYDAFVFLVDVCRLLRPLVVHHKDLQTAIKNKG